MGNFCFKKVLLFLRIFLRIMTKNNCIHKRLEFLETIINSLVTCHWFGLVYAQSHHRNRLSDERQKFRLFWSNLEYCSTFGFNWLRIAFQTSIDWFFPTYNLSTASVTLKSSWGGTGPPLQYYEIWMLAGTLLPIGI